MLQSELPICCQDPNWYVLFVRSNQERQVARHLQSRNLEHYLPCYCSVRDWKDRRVTLEMPLFPGYVFVRLCLPEKVKAITVPNVVGLLGTRDTPSSISNEEIHRIRMGVEYGNAEPCAYLKQGDRVRITSGVMAGLEGMLVRRQNGMRMVIALDSIGRAFRVEVDASCLRPIPVRAPQHVWQRSSS